MKEIKDYFVGLDVGTGSVGWAAADEQYRLLKCKRKDLWGSHCFETAKTAETRRLFRGARRRIARRRRRIKLLQELFAKEIAKCDAGFFQRLKESALNSDDKSIAQKNSLFNDENFTDKTYHKKYPTIHHLVKAWIDGTAESDVRLLYLACHAIIKKRGHFLFEGNFDSNNQFDSSINALLEYLREDMDIDLGSNVQDIKEVLQDTRLKRKDKKEKLNNLLGVGKSEKQKDAVVTLLCGMKAKFSKLYDNPELDKGSKKGISFSDDNFEDMSDELASLLGSDFELLLKAKAVYNCTILSKIIGEHKYLSYAKVELYEKHKKDLVLLKRLVKDLFKEEYETIFGYPEEKKVAANYSMYAGVYRKKGQKVQLEKTVPQEEFYEVLKKILEKKSDNEDVKKILDEIELRTFLPKQVSKNNGELPYQLRKIELEAILANAKAFFPFLNEKDDKGLSISDKIIKLLTFKIPYYIGPVNDLHKNEFPDRCWIVKREDAPKEQITPWNFFDHIDENRTAEAFINSRTNFCTYLIGESVLPKHSLLYSEYTVLNELNNIKIIIHGKDIYSVPLKQKIFNALFKQYKTVTQQRIKDFLIHEGLCEKSERDDIVILGIDQECTSSLKSYIELRKIFAEAIDTDLGQKMAEDIIYWATVYDEGSEKQILVEKIKYVYPALCTDECIQKILKLSFSEWGRLSRKLLELVPANMPEFNEPVNIITAMRETNNNLMKLLSNNYGYTKVIAAHNADFHDERKTGFSYGNLVKDLYVSPSVKRMLWQTLRIMHEIVHITKKPPKKICIEMTRSEESEPKRSKTRLSILKDLYENCKKDANSFANEINALLQKVKNEDNIRLRSDKLYLYYTQMGRCMYCGKTIEIENVFNANRYDIDHIYPQSVIKDDSLNNRVLVCCQCNQNKKNIYPVHTSVQEKRKEFWSFLLRHQYITTEKYNRLTRTNPISDDEIAQFIARQLVETRQATKIAASLLKRLFPDTQIVYSKAAHVSLFRQKFGLIKCRDTNDFHHAHDAYLNIVVGNVYNVRFTNNPWNFIKEVKSNAEQQEPYNFFKVFDSTVQRNGISAWVKEHTINTVKATLSKNTPIYTRQAFCKKGGFFDQTMMKKGHGQHPLKKSGALSNIEKYGGYNKVAAAYFVLVDYEKKHKKIRSFEEVPLYLAKAIEQDKTLLHTYLVKELSNDTVKILVPKIKIYSLLKINGFPVHLTGKSENRLLLRPAVQFCCSEQDTLYFKRVFNFNTIRQKNQNLEPYNDMSLRDYVRTKLCNKKDNDSISKEEFEAALIKKNSDMYDMFTERHQNSIYKYRPNSATITILKNGREQFIHLSLTEQLAVIKEVLKLFTATNGASDLTKIGGDPNSGDTRMNKKITKCITCSLICQSVTGIFEKRIDLLSI